MSPVTARVVAGEIQYVAWSMRIAVRRAVSALVVRIADRVQGPGRSSLASCRAGGTLPWRVDACRAARLETPRYRQRWLAQGGYRKGRPGEEMARMARVDPIAGYGSRHTRRPRVTFGGLSAVLSTASAHARVLLRGGHSMMPAIRSVQRHHQSAAKHFSNLPQPPHSPTRLLPHVRPRVKSGII